MQDNVRVGVCMTAYNGPRFIEEKVLSTLAGVVSNDELLIVDASPTDGNIVNAIVDSGINLHPNERNLGYVRTFERAITLNRGNSYFYAIRMTDGFVDAGQSA